MKYGHTGIIALSVLALAACSDSPSEPVEHPFEYNLTVTGALTADVRGRPAQFALDTDFEGAPIFAIALGMDTSSHTILLARRGHQRPAVGTYNIADVETSGNPWNAAFIVSDGEDLAEVYVSELGEIRILESTPQRVRGTVDFTAVPLFGGGTASTRIRVKGTFDAKLAVEPAGMLRMGQ